MSIDQTIAELGHRLLSSDNKILHDALLETAELLNHWSRSFLTAAPSLLENEEARAFIRSCLIECIDRDPARPITVTLIWVLGKLYDQSLESYLAKLAALFVSREDLHSHLHQTLIALDNLELVPAWQEANEMQSMATMQRIVAEYLRMREN